MGLGCWLKLAVFGCDWLFLAGIFNEPEVRRRHPQQTRQNRLPHGLPEQRHHQSRGREVHADKKTLTRRRRESYAQAKVNPQRPAPLGFRRTAPKILKKDVQIVGGWALDRFSKIRTARFRYYLFHSYFRPLGHFSESLVAKPSTKSPPKLPPIDPTRKTKQNLREEQFNIAINNIDMPPPHTRG